MRNVKTYFLVAHVNHNLKMISISTHQANTKTGTTVNTVYSKARYSYDQIINGKSNKNIQKGLDGGFGMVLLNTGLDGWEDRYFNLRNYDQDTILKFRTQIYDAYENNGYQVVGARNFIPRGITGAGVDNWGKKVPNLANYKKDQILEKVKKMLIGANIDDDQTHQAALAVWKAAVTVNGPEFNFWGDVLVFVHNYLNIQAK